MSEAKLVTHYDSLKVARNSPLEVIRAAYRALCQKYHPDKYPDRERAERVMKILNQAYEVLSDPVRRREHDAWIAEQEALKVARERQRIAQEQQAAERQQASEKQQAAERQRAAQSRERSSGAAAMRPQSDDAIRFRHETTLEVRKQPDKYDLWDASGLKIFALPFIIIAKSLRWAFRLAGVLLTIAVVIGLIAKTSEWLTPVVKTLGANTVTATDTARYSEAVEADNRQRESRNRAYRSCIETARANYEATWADACVNWINQDRRAYNACIGSTNDLYFCRSLYTNLEPNDNCTLPHGDSITQGYREAQQRCLTEAQMGLSR